MMEPIKHKIMIKPIRDNIVVSPYPSDEVSAGGIFVPESARETSNKMKVLAVGNGTPQEHMRFKVGDTAFRVKDTGDEIIIDGERCFIVKQSYLLAQLN